VQDDEESMEDTDAGMLTHAQGLRERERERVWKQRDRRADRIQTANRDRQMDGWMDRQTERQADR
jgi:hypothetical protein